MNATKSVSVKSLVWFGVVVLAVAGSVTAWSLLKDDESAQTGIHTTPVVWDSFKDAQRDNDATLVVTITSDGKQYTDHGANGEPEFDGDPGMPAELVTARVDEVVQGDQSLVGKTITIQQFPRSVEVSEGEDADHMTNGNSYLIIATERSASPGVGDGGPVWFTPLSGQGVFNYDNGNVSPRVAGIFPETFGADGKTVVNTEDLK